MADIDQAIADGDARLRNGTLPTREQAEWALTTLFLHRQALRDALAMLDGSAALGPTGVSFDDAPCDCLACRRLETVDMLRRVLGEEAGRG